MDALNLFRFSADPASKQKAQEWDLFLSQNGFNFKNIQQIDLTEESAVIYDANGNRFGIDFLNDRQNYHKKKASMKKELLGRAMGSGRYGLRVLDLSAGLGVDAIFLNQLGFEVTAVERNPMIYLALADAARRIKFTPSLEFVFDQAQKYLRHSKKNFDVIYFDPMFPEKIKSALPRQEMVFFRHLVGPDEDAAAVLESALSHKGAQRVVVKRPLKAPPLLKKPHSQILGKLVRFDLYGVHL